MNYTQYQNQCAWQKHVPLYQQQQQGMISGMPQLLLPSSASAIHQTTPPSAGPSNKRRTRTVFTPQSISYLESEFNRNAYPDYEARCHYAQLLNVSEDRIQVWFQNKRSRSRGKKLNRGSPPSTRTSPNNNSQSSWLGSAANSPMSSSDSSAVSMTSLDTSIPLQKPVSMPSQAQQHSWNTTPACQPPRTTSSRPPTLHQNRGAIQHHTQLPNLPVQQPCLPLTTRPCKRELDSSLNEPASKRHQTTAATSDNDFELCDLVIDISPESVSEPNISSNATQHASTRQHMSSHNNHSSIDSNISAEDVFTQPIPVKQGQTKPLQISHQNTPDSNIFQFPTPNSFQTPRLTSTAKNCKRRPSSLRLDSLELPLSTPCPSLFNGLSPLWNVPFSPLYIPSPRLMLSKHFD